MSNVSDIVSNKDIITELSSKYQNLFKYSYAPLSSTSLYFIHKNFKKPYPQYIDEKINRYKNIIRKIPADELYYARSVNKYIDTKDEYAMHLFCMAYHDLLEEDEEFRNVARQRPEMKSKGIRIPSFHDEDMDAYKKYFDSIRDYIINNIDKFSTQSLLRAITSYHEEGESEFGDCERIKQVLDIYNYCKEHPNNVEPNEKDLILGYLLVSGFRYEGSGYEPDYDEVESFLHDNDIYLISGSGGSYVVYDILDIERALKLLMPEFNVPQPIYHYHFEGFPSIDALNNLFRLTPNDYYKNYH